MGIESWDSTPWAAHVRLRPPGSKPEIGYATLGLIRLQHLPAAQSLSML